MTADGRLLYLSAGLQVLDVGVPRHLEGVHV